MNGLYIFIGVLVFFVMITTVIPLGVYYFKYKNIEGFSNTDCNKIMTNGYEKEYDRDRWNNHSDFNNCYAYATGQFLENTMRKLKPQPGDKSGDYPKIHSDEYTCKRIEERMKSDFPKLYNVEENELCNEDYYKIALAVDPKKDYHFYKQDSTGYWSHKPGKLVVRQIDASKQKITNPRCADRKYKSFDYSDFCGYYCFSE